MDIEKRRSFIINFMYFFIWIVVVFAFAKYLLPLIMPFLLAFLIAYILKIPIKFLDNKIKIGYKKTAVLTVMIFYALIILLICFIGSRIVVVSKELIHFVPFLYQNSIVPTLTEVFNMFEKFIFQIDKSLFEFIKGFDTQIMAAMGNIVSAISAWAMGVVSGAASFFPGFFIKTILMIISSFFIAADYYKITNFCMNQFNEKSKLIFMQMKKYLVGTLFVCIRSYAIIMCLTFVELSIGLTIIGVEHSILIAAIIALFDILPLLGTGGIMIPWAIISVMLGNYKLAIGLAVVYLAITVIRNIVEPKLVGSQLGLHPILALAGMFVGLQLFGFVGIFGMPILLSLIIYLNNNGIISVYKTSDNKN